MAVASTTLNTGVHLGADIHANRPATALGGALYSCTTHSLVYKYVTGTGWVTWATLTGSGLTDPTTTKGDLITRSASAVVRQAVGSDKTALVADSAQTNGISWVALDDSYVAPVTPNDQTASYTAALADKHRLVRISNASANTFTIPPNSSVAFPLGTSLQIAQQGAGQTTLTAGAGVTIRTPHGAKTSAQYAIAAATKVATDEWYISGDTTT